MGYCILQEFTFLEVVEALPSWRASLQLYKGLLWAVQTSCGTWSFLVFWLIRLGIAIGQCASALALLVFMMSLTGPPSQAYSLQSPMGLNSF